MFKIDLQGASGNKVKSPQKPHGYAESEGLFYACGTILVLRFFAFFLILCIFSVPFIHY